MRGIPKLTNENKTTIFLFTVLISIGLICQRSRHHDLQTNGKLVFVEVYKITLDQYGRPDIHVNYKYNGEEYYESRSFANLSYNRCNNYLLGQKVGVVFSKKNPTNIQILITPLSFKNAGLEMPDSSKVLFEKIQSSW